MILRQELLKNEKRVDPNAIHEVSEAVSKMLWRRELKALLIKASLAQLRHNRPGLPLRPCMKMTLMFSSLQKAISESVLDSKLL